MFLYESHSNFSLLAYRETIDFRILTLYSATLLDMLISTGSFFFNRFFGIFYIDDHATCEQRQYYFFLSNLCIFFPFLIIDLARTTSTLLNRSGER